MNKKLYPLLVLLLITALQGFAQTVDVNFNGLGFLDNREYKAFIPRSHTFSGTRTAFDIGLNLDSLNHFVVGVNGLHEFGAHPFWGDVAPVAYYRFQSKTWQFFGGEFPREGLTTDFPRALMTDTLRYYRPNIQGLLATYTSPSGQFTETGFIDWLSRQTMTDREQFVFAAKGKYTPVPRGAFYIAHYFELMHDAGAEVLLPNDHIGDNGGLEVKLGLDLTRKQMTFDTLSFEAGTLISLERVRGVDGFQTPKGFVFNAYAGFGHGHFAVFEEFYAGQGSHITLGDSYYSKPTYNRLDLIFTPFIANHLRGSFIASFHFSPGQFNDNQEAFRISYDLGRKVIARFRDN